MKENRIVPSYPSIARLEEHLSLKSLSARTREEYPRYIRKLAERFGKDPALLGEQDAWAYLLYLKEKKKYAPSSMRIAVAAMQMFFGGVLGHDWKLFSIVRCPDLQRLPIVLSREEVRRLLSEVHEPRFRVILQLIYSCGTWTRQLAYHPHVHYIVPGGGLRPDGGKWRKCRITKKGEPYLLPVELLSHYFRHRFEERLRAQAPEIFNTIASEVWLVDWIVHSQSAGAGREALGYLFSLRLPHRA